MIIKESEARVKKIDPIVIKEYVINNDFSGALVEIDGDHGALKSLREDRIYFIIKGSGKFIINNK